MADDQSKMVQNYAIINTVRNGLAKVKQGIVTRFHLDFPWFKLRDVNGNYWEYPH